MHAWTDLAEQLGAGNDLRKRSEALVEHGGIDAEILRERVVLRPDLREPLVRVAASYRRVEERDERVRDADERRVHDDGSHAFGEAFADEVGDDGPVSRGGNAATAELEHDPRRIRVRGVDGVACAEHWLCGHDAL